MNLIVEYAKEDRATSCGAALDSPIGRWRDLPFSVVQALSRVVSDTRGGSAMTVLLAVNYGAARDNRRSQSDGAIVYG